jgi:hypothetical protein
LCPSTVEIPEAWGFPKGPSDSEASVVSPHLVPPLIEMEVTPLQYSPDLTPVFEGDVSPIPVVMHPLQIIIEEVVVPVQYLVDPTHLMGTNSSFNHVIIILDPTPYEREICILSLSVLPPSPKKVPFNWDGLIGYPIPPPMSFPVRDIILSITKTIYYISALSSSTWRALGFPKIMSSICKILTFHRSPTWEPWLPP